MAVEYGVDAQARLIRILATGEFGDAEVGVLRTAVVGDERWRPEFALLADFRGVTKVTASTGSIRDLVASIGGGPLGRAAVITDRLVLKGLSNMFALLVGDRARIRAVGNEAEAMEWLRSGED